MAPGEAPPTQLAGVGPRVAEKLARLGIERSRDLLFHLPLRYEDRTRIHPVGALRPGQRALIEGEVLSAGIVHGRRRMLVWVLGDGSGRITMRMFNFYPNQQRQLRRGAHLRCFGEVRSGPRGLEMIHPEYRPVADCKPPDASLTPYYPTTEGLGQSVLRKLTDQALASREEWAAELLPTEMLQRIALPPLTDSLDYVHRPPPAADLALLAEGRHPCQQRLAFEELLAHRLGLRQLRRRIRRRRAPALAPERDLAGAFITALPFRLTAAQQRVIGEIATDLATTVPTMRLIQGDVGSGKTVIAAAAAAQAIAAGYQAALAAPTEILAEQHVGNLSEWFEPLGIRVAWLSGKIRGRKRAAALAEIAGDADLVVGTHALMQEGVDYARLGLVIVDEQHRFGVHQRLALKSKGAAGDQVPHQLIMTATPIPRSLAMTAYADLDLSVVDELPPNRLPVKTVAVGNARRGDVIERVRAACAGGQQAFWGCTISEESESLRAEAASDVAASLAEQLPEVEIGLIHGRLKAAEKEAVMAEFKDGRIQLLVATTVIEVGVDVPNASLMIIENAERLGLSQLHQLRGRVGRGNRAATCVLLYQPPLSPTARERLAVLRKSSDGFAIARKDLELRGPGEVLGTRQTGMAQFRIADLARDRALLDRVAECANELLRHHPERVAPLIRRWVGAASSYAEV